MFSPKPGSGPESLWHVASNGRVEKVNAWPTDHPAIYMVSCQFEGVKEYDLFENEQQALHQALEQQREQISRSERAIWRIQERLGQVGQAEGR